MCFTVDQIDRACGLLLLNEFNSFIYCCKKCTCEFESGPHLEVHILSEHQDDKEAVFVDDEVFAENFDSRLVETGSTNIKHEHFEGNVEILDDELKKPNKSELKEEEVVKESNLLNKETANEDSSEDDDIPLADLLVNSDFNADERNDESTIRISKCVSLAKDEVSCVKKRRGRPFGWRKRRNSNSDESYTKKNPARPRGRPPGSKNKIFFDDGIVHDYSITNDMETPMKKTGRPTTGTFYCDMCPKLVFDGKMNLTRHMHFCHIVEKRKCEICNKIPRKGYDRHMKKFHSIQPLHKCNLCDATFKVQISLVVHMRKHRGEKPYLCETCGKSFSSQGLYRNHEIRIHTNIRNYQCQLCDRSFYRKYRLRDHINAFHTNERPHVCEVCGKGFASASYLRVHKLTHGEKLLQCRYCDRMFKLSENRHKHEVSIHKVMKTNNTAIKNSNE